MTAPLPPLAIIPPDIVAPSDYLPYAQARMTEMAWAYFSGGAGEERVLAQNEKATEAYRILPRVLTEMQQASTHFSLLGKSYAFPIFLAPVAYQRLAHPDGELASALAAAAMQTPFVISMQSSVGLEILATQAPGPQWLQWYWQPDQQASQRLLRQAVQLGIEAIVLTVDAPVQGIRYREQRAQFQLPKGIDAVNLRGFKQKPLPMAQAGQSPLFGTGFLQEAPTWTQITEFIAQSPLPVLLKGILHPEDAKQAVASGAAGIVVSNHGGRALDAVPTSFQMLPAIAQEVAGRIPILLDGGIRRGSDVFVALALGASAVLIGRPYVYGLAAAGASGVAHVLHMLRTEFEITMALAGCARLDQIQSRCIWQP